jgi:hypothetical protein
MALERLEVYLLPGLSDVEEQICGSDADASGGGEVLDAICSSLASTYHGETGFHS